MVVVNDAAVWEIPWGSFGAEVEGILKRSFIPVNRPAQGGPGLELTLYLRRDRAAAFVDCARKL